MRQSRRLVAVAEHFTSKTMDLVTSGNNQEEIFSVSEKASDEKWSHSATLTACDLTLNSTFGAKSLEVLLCSRISMACPPL